MGLFEGKRGIVFGVANRNSIAWGIAQRLSQEGADLALHYANERFERNVASLAEQLERPPALLMADVTDDAQIEALYRDLGSKWDSIDFVVHSIAHAHADDLNGRFIDISRDGFAFALDVSAYSLIAVARGALPLMSNGGSIVTLSYIASERVFPGYNVMAVAKAALENIVRYLAFDVGADNIRVNAISSGPMNTLSARGISGFRAFQERAREHAALKRDITQEELGNAAVFLLSDLGTGVTGETIFVDAGYHMAGM
jgi:enoyl-[acyl-carrier protein] reductase I